MSQNHGTILKMKNNNTLGDIAGDMIKILQEEISKYAGKADSSEEFEKAETTLSLIRSTELLINAASNFESLGKEGEAKFLWKLINTAQTKLRNEINETPPIKKEAAVQNSYQKYSNLLEGKS